MKKKSICLQTKLTSYITKKKINKIRIKVLGTYETKQPYPVENLRATSTNRKVLQLLHTPSNSKQIENNQTQRNISHSRTQTYDSIL